jgi:hypothetical protein
LGGLEDFDPFPRCSQSNLLASGAQLTHAHWIKTMPGSLQAPGYSDLNLGSCLKRLASSRTKPLAGASACKIPITTPKKLQSPHNVFNIQLKLGNKHDFENRREKPSHKNTTSSDSFIDPM